MHFNFRMSNFIQPTGTTWREVLDEKGIPKTEIIL